MKYLLALLLLVTLPVLATGTPKKPTPPKTTPPSVVMQNTTPDYDRKLANAVGAGLASGFAATALRSEPYGYAYAFVGTIAAAAAIEAAHAGPFQSDNLLWAAGGAAIGTVGTCMVYFRKGFVGCAMPF
jgi:hypothetical protein